MLASIFADGILLRGNFMAKVGVRPGASGSRKLASESLIQTLGRRQLFACVESRVRVQSNAFPGDGTDHAL